MATVPARLVATLSALLLCALLFIRVALPTRGHEIPQPVETKAVPIAHPWTSTRDGLYLMVPQRVLPLDARSQLVEFPPNQNRLWIEVGVYKISDFWAVFQEHPRETQSLAVWGIEPNSRFVMDHPVHSAFTLFNAAASDHNGASELRLWSPTGASLLPLGPAHARYLAPGDASRANSQAVATIRLDSLLCLVPPHVAIEYIKVDAQGSDLAVLRGAGDQLLRVRAVTAECQDLDRGENDPRRFYEGACRVADLRAYMRTWGFTEQECVLQNADIAEYNCHFARNARVLRNVRALFEKKAVVI